MEFLLKAIAEIAYRYGVEGAGMPSYRGSYEEEVPSELKKELADSEND